MLDGLSSKLRAREKSKIQEQGENRYSSNYRESRCGLLKHCNSLFFDFNREIQKMSFSKLVPRRLAEVPLPSSRDVSHIRYDDTFGH